MGMNAMEWAQAIALVLGGIGAAVAAGAYLLSTARKQAHKEVAALAETRGDYINDLETKMAHMEARIAALEAEITSVHRIKAAEIANAVALKLAELGVLDGN